MVYFLLQYQAQMFISSGILPPHSDSLSYQVYALNALEDISKNAFRWREFIYGDVNESVPPLYKILLLLSYMLGGLESGSEYIVNYLLVIISGIYLGKISLFLFKNKYLFYITLVTFITLNGINNFSIFDTRNDTLTITLYIMGVYYFFKSDIFLHKKESIVVAVVMSLALLTKSAFGGYILLPFFLIVLILFTSNEKKQRFKNLFLALFIVILLISFYYFPKYHAILDYYSFWSKELSSIVYEQYNIKNLSDKLMFYPQSTLNHFGYTLYVFLPFLPFLVYQVFKKKISFFQIDLKFYILLIGFALLPYLILIINGSFSIVADLYMVPFLLVILVSFLTSIKHNQILNLMFVVFTLIGINNIIKHYQNPVENDLNYQKFSSLLQSILSKNNLDNKKVYPLFYDLDLNDKTIEYLNVKDKTLRKISNIKTSNISYKYRVDPRLSYEEIYNYIKSNTDILLVTNRQIGPSWIKINQEWNNLYSKIKQDDDFKLIGIIDAYFDGTKIYVYTKNSINYNLTRDGWLENNSKISINSKKGTFIIAIQDIYNYSNINELYIEDRSGSQYPCKVVNAEIYECVVENSSDITFYTLKSSDPLIPSRQSNSLDNRELLFFKPKIILIKSLNQ
jgi:hypothetical protein